jgi:hypothetical protein
MKRLCCLVAFLPATAQAAIHCQYHDQAVADAAVIIQITDQQIAHANEPGWCSITGTVQRSFRGDLALGTTVTTRTPCDGAAFPPGPQIITGYADLAAATVIELHMTGSIIASHGAGLAILPALTDFPARLPMCPD